MAKLFTSLVGLQTGSMYKERVGEKGTTHAQQSDKEAFDLKIYDSKMSLEESWQIRHDGANSSKLTADFANEELESTFPLAKFSGESRIEQKLNVGDLSGAAPAIKADASVNGSAFIELDAVYKAEQHATAPKMSIYDVDVVIGSNAAQAAAKSLTAQLHTYSFEATNQFVAGFTGAYVLSLDINKAALQSSARAELKNLTSAAEFYLTGTGSTLDIQDQPYVIQEKLFGTFLYKATPSTATAEPKHEWNGDFNFSIEQGAGIGRWKDDSGSVLMQIEGDSVVVQTAGFTVEDGAGGPIQTVEFITEDWKAEAHQEILIENTTSAAGKYRLEAEIDALGSADILMQARGAAAGDHHIKLFNGGVDIAKNAAFQENVGIQKKLTVIGQSQLVQDVQMDANASIAGDLTITGNLTVNGATVEVQGTQVTFEDTIFDMGQDNASGLLNQTLDLGFMMNYQDATSGNAEKASIYWDQSETRFKLAARASETNGIITSATLGNLHLKVLEAAAVSAVQGDFDKILMPKGSNSGSATIKLDASTPGAEEFKMGSVIEAIETAGGSLILKGDDIRVRGNDPAKAIFSVEDLLRAEIGASSAIPFKYYDGSGTGAANEVFVIDPASNKIHSGASIAAEFKGTASVAGALVPGANILTPDFSVDGDAVIKNDLEVEGILYAASASFASSDFQALEADYLHLESDEVRFIMAEPEDALVANMGSSAVEHFSIILPGAAAAIGRTAEIKSSLPLNLDADADIQGDAVLRAKLSVASEATFLDKANVAAKFTASDLVDLAAAGKLTDIKGSLAVAEDASLAAKLSVTGKLTASDDLAVSGDSTLTGDVSMGANASVANDLAVSGQITGALNAVISGNVNATDLNASNEISAVKDILSGQDIYVKRDLIPGDKAGDVGAQSIGQALKPFETAYIGSIIADQAALTADLDVGGDLEVAGKSKLDGDVTAGAKLSVADDASLSAKLDVAGDATLSSKLDVSGDASLGAKLIVASDTQLNGKLDVAQIASFASDIAVTGKADITSHANIGGDIDANGEMDLAGKLEFAAAGLTSRSRGSLIVDEDLTVSGASILNGADFSGDVDIAGKLNVQGDTTLVKLDATGAISTTQGLVVAKTATFGADISVVADASVGGDLAVTGDASAANINATTDANIGNLLDVGSNATIGGDITGSGKLDITGNADLRSDARVYANLQVDAQSTLTGDVSMGADASIGQDLSVSRDLSVGRDSALSGKLTVSGFSELADLKVNGGSQFVNLAQFDANLRGVSATAQFEWGGAASGSQAGQPGYNFHVAPAANFKGDVHIDQDLAVDGTINGNHINITGNFQNHIDIEQPYRLAWRDSANAGIAGRLQGLDDRIFVASTEFDYAFSLEGLEGGLGSNIQNNDTAVAPAVSFKAFDLGTITDSGWQPAQAHSAGTGAAKWMITCRANKAIAAGVDPMNGATSALAQGMQYKLNKDNAADPYAKGDIVYLSPAVAGAVTNNLPQMEGDHVMIVGKVVEDSPNGAPMCFVAISMHYMYRI